MLIGYICVSKRNGSQVFDLRQDALVEAGVDSKEFAEANRQGRKALTHFRQFQPIPEMGQGGCYCA